MLVAAATEVSHRLGWGQRLTVTRLGSRRVTTLDVAGQDVPFSE